MRGVINEFLTGRLNLRSHWATLGRLVVTSPNLQQVLSCAVSPGFQLCADKINSWIPELAAALNPS